MTTFLSERVPLSDDITARLSVLPAANVGDAQERLGVMDSGISPVWPGARFVGPALTVLCAPGDNLFIHSALDIAQPGEVIVVNGGGDLTRALLGELIGERAARLGVAGFVIDGCVRDAEALAEVPMPVFARGLTPAGPYKNGPGYLQRPVAMGGVVVETGDIIVADADGVVVTRRSDLEDVLIRAEAKFADETAKRAEIRAGKHD